MARRKHRFAQRFTAFNSSRDISKKLRGDNFLIEALEDRSMLATMVPGELLVQFDHSADAVSRANVRAQVSGLLTEQIQTAAMVDAGQGVLERITLGNGLSVDAAIQRIRSMRGVAFAEPNWVYTTADESNDTHYLNGNLWGMYGDDSPTATGPAGTTNEFGSQAEKAWANGFVGSNDVFIGVIDEGIQFTHPDLIDNVWNNPYDPVDGIDNDGNGRIDDSQGWDFFSNDRTVYDGPGDDHGTHVAGTIGAKGGNADGVAGVNWNVTMISAKFLGPGGGTTYDAIQAIDYLTDLKTRHGLNIVATNNSWGGGEYSQALLDAITRAANQDILFVASAGNFATDNDDWAHYPSNYDTTAGAGYDAVISVAAIDNTGALSSFSNYGDASVDLGAPGSAVYSTLPDGYGFKSGTSMASPHVSGALALFAAATPGLPAVGMRNMLLGSVAPTSSLADITVTGGRLEIDRFLTAPLAISGISINNVSLFEGHGGSTFANFTVTLSPTANQIVTLNYATADGSASAGNDYGATSGVLTFEPGETSKSVLVEVFGDTVAENHESFFLLLSAATNAVIVDARGYGKISNDDAISISIDDVTVIEGNSGTKLATFTVSFDAVSTAAINVNYATSNGTATAGSDYTAKTGTLFFGIGETSKTISITVLGDTVIEANETFNVNLTSATSGTFNDSVGVGTIDNDDVSMSINNVTLAEGNSGTTLFGFVVSLSAATFTTVTVNYATANASAIAGVDYTATSGTLTFAPGDTSKTISVAVLGDTVYENNESFSVNLSGASVAVTDSLGSGIILNDDIGLSIASQAFWYEHVIVPATRSIAVNLTGPSAQTITVNYHSEDNTATAEVDYGAVTGTLTFLPGETTKNITFDIFEDVLSEGEEWFQIVLTNASNVTITNSVGSVKINDNDTILFYLQDATVSEGNSGTTPANFTLTLNYVSTRTVQVSYLTFGSTASTGLDFVSTTGTVTFLPGEMSKSFSVSVVGDTLAESNEQFHVFLNNAVNSAIADPQGIVTILDDDSNLSINNVSVMEGNSGSTFANFTVTLSPASSNTVTVNYATTNSSATAGVDYVATSGTLSFLPGETTKSISVEILGDLVDEGTEFYSVNLSGATYAIISDATGQGTIVKDDYMLRISSTSLYEGNSGSSSASFTVLLTAISPFTISVNYATADGSATAGSDYVSTNGTVTFLPGETQKTVTVPVLGDQTFESLEEFFVNLSNPVNGIIEVGTGNALIRNDDIPISISDFTFFEGHSGSTVANFTVTLGTTWNGPISIDFATSDGTAFGGSDYTVTSGTLTFLPLQTSSTISIPIIGDTVYEAAETFNINLFNPVGCVITDGSAVGTIINDDIGVWVSDATQYEMNGPSFSLHFRVELSSVTTVPVSVNYSTANGSAIAGSDYTATSGTLTFAPGQNSIYVDVPLLSDTVIEPIETMSLILSNPVGATMVDEIAVGTIVDDDVSVSVSDASLAETNSGSVNMGFVVSLSGPTIWTVTMNYATANVTASAGSDYSATTGSLTFAPGETSKTVYVPVLGDTTTEANETFRLNLSSVVDAILLDGVGVGTIINDDVAPSFSINDVSGAENSGTLVLTVTLSAPTSITTKVKYATANGTAQGGNNGSADFNHASGTLTFSPGQTSKTVTVTLRNDSTVEPNEIFYVNLSTPTGATIADNQGIGTILNDDGGGSSIVSNQVTDGGAEGMISNANPSTNDPIVKSRNTRGESQSAGADLTTARDADAKVLVESELVLEVVTLDNAELSRVKLVVSPSIDRRWGTNLSA